MKYPRLMLVLAMSAVFVWRGFSSATTLMVPRDNWWPSSGAVILAGGNLSGESADAFVDRLIALAGGPEASIVVIPTASDGLPTRLPISGPESARIQDLRRHLESRGAHHIAFLHTRDRQVANTDDFVKELRTANGVFFPGGAARVLDQTYHGTLVERELKALLKRGGVLAGDSAGAITLGCEWLDWNPKANEFGKSTEGLCVLANSAVTPHVQNAEGDERLEDVFKYIAAHPSMIGINIEGNTFLVLKGGSAEVFGKGSISIFDGAKDKTKPSIHMTSGERRDLAK
jgi:cyanophycinase